MKIKLSTISAYLQSESYKAMYIHHSKKQIYMNHVKIGKYNYIPITSKITICTSNVHFSFGLSKIFTTKVQIFSLLTIINVVRYENKCIGLNFLMSFLTYFFFFLKTLCKNKKQNVLHSKNKPRDFHE